MSAWEGLALGALVLLALTLAVTAGDRQKERRRRNGPQKRHHHPR